MPYGIFLAGFSRDVSLEQEFEGGALKVLIPQQ